MGSFKNKVQETIVKESLFCRDDRLLVSFSGGADSVSLVYALVSLGYKKLILLYFDHGLRSDKERDFEKRFVKDFANKLKVSYRIMSLPIQFIADQYGYSLESAGHEARYYCLERFAGIYGIKTVLMAHHKDDLLETLLLQLGRGSVFHMGLPLKHVIHDIMFARPLLAQSKQDIVAYCEEEKVSYCEDSSNTDLSFQRNHIRHELIPVLSQYTSSFDDHLNILFQRVQASYETLEFQQLVSSCNVLEHPCYFECVISDAAKESDFYLGTIIYQLLKQCYDIGLGKRLKDRLTSHFDCNMAQLTSLKDAVINQQSGEIIHLSKGVSVYCYQQNLYIKKSPFKGSSSQVLSLNQAIEWQGYSIRLERCDYLPESCLSSKTKCYVSLPSSSSVVTVALLQGDDSYMPYQKNEFVNVNKVLAKQGVNAFFRQFCLGFKSNDEIIWIPELGVDKRYLVSDQETCCYKIKLF